MSHLFDTALDDIEGVELVSVMNRDYIGILLGQYMHTTYKIAGGVMYSVDGRSILLPDGGGDGYEVVLDERINEFVTDESSELFDLLSFISL